MKFKHQSESTHLTSTRSLTESRMLRVNPEFDSRLDGFMENNRELTEFYTELVHKNPEEAIRAFMLGKMVNEEARLRKSSRDLEAITSLSVSRINASQHETATNRLSRGTNFLAAVGALQQ